MTDRNRVLLAAAICAPLVFLGALAINMLVASKPDTSPRGAPQARPTAVAAGSANVERGRPGDEEAGTAEVEIRHLGLSIDMGQDEQAGWGPIGDELWWRPTEGTSFRFSRRGPRIYVAVDGGEPRLAGVEIGAMDQAWDRFSGGDHHDQWKHLIEQETAQGLSALREALMDAEGPLTVWVAAGEGLPELAGLPDLSKVHALAISYSRYATGFSDLSPIAGMKDLRAVRLCGLTNLSDISPLAGLTNLRALALEECDGIEDIAPLASLTELSSLSITDCGNVTHLSPLAGLRKLESLRMDDCNGIMDLTPLAELVQLRSLDLTRSPRIRDLSVLQGMTGLQSLGLPPRFSGADLQTLASRIPDLQALALHRESTPGERHEPYAPFALTDLHGFRSLRSLAIGGCDEITDYSPLARLPELRELAISGLDTTDISSLEGLTRLQTLALTPGDGLRTLDAIGTMTGLKALKLHYCGSVRDFSPLANLNGLRELDLCQCNRLSSLRSFAGLSGLRSLRLDWCEGVRDLSPLSGLTDLECLSLSGARSLRDVTPLSGLGKLEVLTIMCTGVTDLSPLAELGNLKWLNLHGSSELTDVSPLADIPKLMHLHMRACFDLEDVSPLEDLVRRGCRIRVDDELQPQLDALQARNEPR